MKQRLREIEKYDILVMLRWTLPKISIDIVFFGHIDVQLFRNCFLPLLCDTVLMRVTYLDGKSQNTFSVTVHGGHEIYHGGLVIDPKDNIIAQETDHRYRKFFCYIKQTILAHFKELITIIIS